MFKKGDKRVSQAHSFSSRTTSWRSSQTRKKGLSPVIATVLLVGLVVVSGLIVFMWFRGLTQEAVLKFDQNIQLACGDVQFDARYSNGEIAISNIGNVPIYGFKVKTQGPGGFDTKDIIEYKQDWDDEGDGLIQGETASVGVPGIPAGSEVTLIPILVGTSQKGAQASFTCDENLYGQVSL